MLRLLFAIAMLCVFSFGCAEARSHRHHHHHHRHHQAIKTSVLHPMCNITMPCDVRPSARVRGSFEGFHQVASVSYGSVSRPMHYIAGRLVCALNVNAALAERGIRGTGSALAHSFDRWGVRVSTPVPGAVAVSDRRGGGHVAIVSRVEGGHVFVWNATGRHHGWYEVDYTNRQARYRVATS